MKESENLPDRFDPPLFAIILNAIGRFWLKHWKWIIGTVIATTLTIAGLYLAYLQYLLQKAVQK